MAVGPLENHYSGQGSIEANGKKANKGQCFEKEADPLILMRNRDRVPEISDACPHFWDHSHAGLLDET